MSISVDPEAEAKRKQAEADAKSKLIADSLAIRMNRVSGTINNLIYLNTIRSSGGTKTSGINSNTGTRGINTSGSTNATNTGSKLISGAVGVIAANKNDNIISDSSLNTKQTTVTPRTPTVYLNIADGNVGNKKIWVDGYGASETSINSEVGYVPAKQDVINQKCSTAVNVGKKIGNTADGNSDIVLCSFSKGQQQLGRMYDNIPDDKKSAVKDIYVGAGISTKGTEEWEKRANTCIDNGTNVHIMYSTKGTNADIEGPTRQEGEAVKLSKGNSGGMGNKFANTIDVESANFAQKYTANATKIDEYDYDFTYLTPTKDKNNPYTENEATAHVTVYSNGEGKGLTYVEEFSEGHQKLPYQMAGYCEKTWNNP